MSDFSFLAVFLGVLIVISRLPGVFYPKEFAKVVKKFLNEDLMRFFAIGPLYLGLAILWKKHTFTDDWESLMVVFGWLFLLGSVMWAWKPEFGRGVANKIFKDESTTSFMCLIGVALGVLLIYLGFYVY